MMGILHFSRQVFGLYAENRLILQPVKTAMAKDEESVSLNNSNEDENKGKNGKCRGGVCPPSHPHGG
jgi:hypothetical protein